MRLPAMFRKDDDELANGEERAAYERLTDPTIALYLEARQEWDERFATHARAAETWRKGFLVATALACAAMVGCLYLASRAAIVPIIVEVDQERGEVVGSYDPRNLNQAVSDNVFRAAITDWITNLRSVTTDPQAQYRRIQRAAAFVRSSDPTFTIADEMIDSAAPQLTAQEAVVQVRLQEFRAIGYRTWYIVWREKKVPRNGMASSTLEYTGTITVTQDAVDESKALINPLGIYIVEFDWSETGALVAD